MNHAISARRRLQALHKHGTLTIHDIFKKRGRQNQYM